MTIQTSKGKEYTVIYAEGPTRLSGTLMIKIQDSRKLAVIAREFDGVETVQRMEDETAAQLWEGYTMITMVRRTAENEVIVELAKP